MADPTRRRIFEALCGQPQTVGELAAGQPVSRPAVSQHMKVLASAKLVSVEPRGNRRVYFIKRQGLEDLREYLEDFWEDTLAAYGAEVTQRLNKEREHSMLKPIIKTIEVPCSQAQAFEIFLDEMSSWWPLDKFTTTAFTGKAAASIRVDAREGGEIIEVNPDGTEYK